VIINIAVVTQGDTLDPNYVWVPLSGYNPAPQVGWTTTDNVNFVQPGLPADVYGNPVTFSTNGTTDTYTNAVGIVATIPHKGPQALAYLSLAIQGNIALLAEAGETFAESRYDDSTRMNLLGLAFNAYVLGLTNRLNYLMPLLTWQNSIIAYIGTYCVNVKAQTSATAVAALTPNFTQFISTDPLLTPIAAMQITD
jgi:hypothetical protein